MASESTCSGLIALSDGRTSRNQCYYIVHVMLAHAHDPELN